MFGTVVDDRGEAVVGAALVGETYAGEPMILGTSGDGGAYRLERLANFPRSFKRVYAGGAPTGELRPTTERASQLNVWPSMLDFEAGSGDPRNQPYYFRERGVELERKITLWRSRTLRGVVVDQAGAPVTGAKVVLVYRSPGNVLAYLPSSIVPPSPYVAKILERCTTTAADGSFELILGHGELAREELGRFALGTGSELVALTADGSMSVQPCDPLALGAERDGIRLVLGPPQVTRIRLTDPGGDIRPQSHPGSLATLTYTSKQSARAEQFHLAIEGNRAELALWPERLPMAGSGLSLIHI